MCSAMRTALNSPAAVGQSDRPSGDMKACPIAATSYDDCSRCALWARENSSIPCSVETVIRAAPTLLAQVAVNLGITFTASRVHYNKTDVVLTYRCFRAKTHPDGIADPHAPPPDMLISVAVGEDVHNKPERRPSPTVDCGCPFTLRLRVFVASEDGAYYVLSTCRAILEFPTSPGWHGDTHSPDTVDSTPIVNGVACDWYLKPVHPDVVQFMRFLASRGIAVTVIARLAQDYMNWLRVFYRKDPLISTAAAPHRILQLSTGVPPVVNLRHDYSTAADGVDDFDPELAQEPLQALPPTSESPTDEASEAHAAEVLVDLANRSLAIDEQDDRDLALQAVEPGVLEAISDAGTSDLMPHFSRSDSLASVLQVLQQYRAYSDFSWIANVDKVSSFAQHLQSRKRKGRSAWQHFLQATIPAYMEAGWISDIRM